jgi:hypothetical protein
MGSIVHELALVRHHDVVTQRKTNAGVVYLKQAVIRVMDVEGGWTLLPDYWHGYPGAAFAVPQPS